MSKMYAMLLICGILNGEINGYGGGIEMIFKKKNKAPVIEFDKEKKKAIIRCSICTGEQVAGFKDKQTGHFTEVMLIRNDRDLNEFMKMYGLSEVPKEY